MKLSTRARYGLKALIDLGLHCETEAVSIQSIASRQNISDSYLEQLMAKLRKADIVTSVRGAQGGYILKRSPKDISVGDVLRALEGDLRPVDCLAIEDENETHCENADLCVTKYVWTRISESINDTVNSITLQDLLNQNKEKNSDERICDCGL